MYITLLRTVRSAVIEQYFRFRGSRKGDFVVLWSRNWLHQFLTSVPPFLQDVGDGGYKLAGDPLFEASFQLSNGLTKRFNQALVWPLPLFCDVESDCAVAVPPGLALDNGITGALL
jgi:hypothetical protein